MRSKIKQRHAPSTSCVPGEDENHNTNSLEVKLTGKHTKGRKSKKDKSCGNESLFSLGNIAWPWKKRLICSVLLLVALYFVVLNVHAISETVLAKSYHSIGYLFKSYNRTDKSLYRSKDMIKDSLANDQKSDSLPGDKSQSEDVGYIREDKYLSQLQQEIVNFQTSITKEFMPRPIYLLDRLIKPIPLRGEKENQDVRVYIYDDFLTHTECDGLRRAHDNHVRATSTQDPILCFDSIETLQKHLLEIGQGHLQVSEEVFTTGTTCVNASFSSELKQWLGSRWSFSTAFYPGESPFTHTFTERVERATKLGQGHGGKFQITSYPQGVGYRSHTDCILGSPELRDRYATVLVYLQDVEEGGETLFTELDLKVTPKKGRALMWTNMDRQGRCLEASIHEAARVVHGHKYILQRWYYFQNFYSLGKRSQEPAIPPRHPGQPRVTCDEFEHGSCRWYDEWNFEHIPQYERQKQSLL